MVFIDPKLFEDDMSDILDIFSSIRCLSIIKNLADAKLLVVSKLLADGELFSVGRHLVDTKHLASIKNVNRSDISAKSDNFLTGLNH